jgi:hypothetical protein
VKTKTEVYQPRTPLELKATIGEQEGAGWAVRQVAVATFGVIVVYEPAGTLVVPSGP